MSEDQASRQPTKMISVRMDVEDVAILSTLAEEYGETLSNIVRIATKTSLERYLGTVRYIDQSQAVRINNNIVSLGNVMVDIRDELHRIGVNLNQTVLAINSGKIRIIDNSCNIPSVEDFEKIQCRMDAAITKAGKTNVFTHQPS